MKKKVLSNRIFIRGMVVICLFLFTGFIPGAVKAKEVSVTTENGAVLLFEKDGKSYTFSGLKKQAEEIMIPDTVKGVSVKQLDFDSEKTYTKVKHIHIPATVTDMSPLLLDKDSNNPFEKFPNLERITVGEGNSYFSVVNDVLLLNKSGALYAVAPGAKGKVTIPAEVKDVVGATSTTYMAFRDLTAVTEFEVEAGNPTWKSVDGILYSKDGKTLVRYPVQKSGKGFSVPKGVKTIGFTAFEGVKTLQKVTMPDTVKKIEDMAFYKASVTEVKLNQNLRSLGQLAFAKSKLKLLKLPEGLREAEIGSIPVHKLVIPENLGNVTIENDYTYENVIMADIIVIKNPMLAIYNWDTDDYSSIWTGKTVYAYKGSESYEDAKRISKYAKKFKLKRLKGKTFKPVPKETGKVDTSWYSKKKKHFTLTTPAQLAGLSKLSFKTNFYGKTIKLGKNLDMKGYNNFCPIQSFRGCFNGNGKTIKNLKIYQREEMVGLFDYINDEEGGKVKNLKVRGKITGGNYTGGIVGYNYHGASIKNCSFSGKVRGYGYHGKIYGNSQEEKELKN